MANNFKSAGVSGVGTSLATASTLYTANTNINSIVIELDIANTSNSAISASVVFEDASANSGSGDTYHIVKNAPLPSGSTLKVVSGQKIVLNGDDSIKVYATSTNVDAIISILEDVE